MRVRSPYSHVTLTITLGSLLVLRSSSRFLEGKRDCGLVSENQLFKLIVFFVRSLEGRLVNAARPIRQSPGMSKSSLANARAFNWLIIVSTGGVTLTLMTWKEISFAHKTNVKKNIVIFCYKASFLSIENSINGFYYSSTLILAEMGSNFLQQVAGLFDLGKKKKK